MTTPQPEAPDPQAPPRRKPRVGRYLPGSRLVVLVAVAITGIVDRHESDTNLTKWTDARAVNQRRSRLAETRYAGRASDPAGRRRRLLHGADPFARQRLREDVVFRHRRARKGQARSWPRSTRRTSISNMPRRKASFSARRPTTISLCSPPTAGRRCAPRTRCRSRRWTRRSAMQRPRRPRSSPCKPTSTASRRWRTSGTSSRRSMASSPARRIDVGALVAATNNEAKALYDISDISKMRVYVHVPAGLCREHAQGAEGDAEPSAISAQVLRRRARYHVERDLGRSPRAARRGDLSEYGRPAVAGRLCRGPLHSSARPRTSSSSPRAR